MKVDDMIDEIQDFIDYIKEYGIDDSVFFYEQLEDMVYIINRHNVEED